MRVCFTGKKKRKKKTARFVTSTRFECSFLYSWYLCLLWHRLALAVKLISFQPFTVSSPPSSLSLCLHQRFIAVKGLLSPPFRYSNIFHDTLALRGALFCFQFSPLPRLEKQLVLLGHFTPDSKAQIEVCVIAAALHSEQAQSSHS